MRSRSAIFVSPFSVSIVDFGQPSGRGTDRAPEVQSQTMGSSGRLLLGVVLVVVTGNVDGDTTWLHRLRQFPNQDDPEHAVLERHVLYLDVFRQVEHAAERPHRDSLM